MATTLNSNKEIKTQWWELQISSWRLIHLLQIILTEHRVIHPDKNYKKKEWELLSSKRLTWIKISSGLQYKKAPGHPKILILRQKCQFIMEIILITLSKFQLWGNQTLHFLKLMALQSSSQIKKQTVTMNLHMCKKVKVSL